MATFSGLILTAWLMLQISRFNRDLRCWVVPYRELDDALGLTDRRTVVLDMDSSVNPTPGTGAERLRAVLSGDHATGAF